MKIKFVLGPYGYEVVLGNISEKIYNKYSQDTEALNDAVSGFGDNSDIKEWSEMDDITHKYGAVLEEEGTDQYLKIFNENNEELLNIPLTSDEIKAKGFNIKEDVVHTSNKDLSEKFYFFGQNNDIRSLSIYVKKGRRAIQTLQVVRAPYFLLNRTNLE